MKKMKNLWKENNLGMSPTLSGSQFLFIKLGFDLWGSYMDNQSMDVNKSKRQVLKSNTKQNEKKNPFQASKTVKANFFPENKTQGIHRCHGAKPAMLKKFPTKVH